MARSRTTVDSIGTGVALLAVVALGLTAGAMLAEACVLVPYWRALPPDAFLRWYGDNADRLLDFFGPLEIASTLVALVAAVLFQLYGRPGGGLLTVAAVLAIDVLVTFPLYFQDVNASFAAGTIAVDQVGPELARWATWHWARTALGIGAFVAALLAVREKR